MTAQMGSREAAVRQLTVPEANKGYMSGFGNGFETEALPGALPVGRRRRRPADRRLQRSVADGRERRGGHVPRARRPPTDRGRQGGQRQPRADRQDLSRATAGRGGARRRRCVDAADTVPEAALPAPTPLPPVPATGTALAGSTSAGCHCSSPTSGVDRTPCR